MSHDLIIKKIEQMTILLKELRELLVLPYKEFKDKFTNIRSAERNFQLIVELATDINTHIIVELGGITPDTYRQSFQRAVDSGVIDPALLSDLVKSSNLRNILIHEYDFDQDNFIFYNSAIELVPVYENYLISIKKYLESNKG